MDFPRLANICEQYKVLYVEDEENVRLSTYETIKELFKDVIIAKDGLEGLELFKSNSGINLIISDVKLPKLDGIEMISVMKSMNENLATIIISAYDDKTLGLKESLKLKIDGILQKPLNLESLYSVLISLPAHVKKTSFAFSDLNQELLKRNFDYIAVIDINNFAVINRLEGKSSGDKILNSVTNILKSFENESLQVFKIESDKYALLLKGKKERIISMIELMFLIFKEPKTIDLLIKAEIGFNVGLAKISQDRQEMINAEYALQKAKESTIQNLYFYDPNDESIKKEKETVTWYGITKRLIRECAIEPFFQPIVNLKTGEIDKYEVLSRGILDDEEINPYFFIPIAEKTGLICEVTKMIIKKSFEKQRMINKNLSINLSNQDLLGDYLIPFLEESLALYNVDARDITFEIVENITLKENSVSILETLNALKKLGFSLAIDDFGTDNSNFKRLVDIDCDILKIDRIFIQNITNNEKSLLIVQAIVNLAKTLRMETVAEFVENEEIVEKIKECGVDYAQGYFYGKPIKIG